MRGIDREQFRPEPFGRFRQLEYSSLISPPRWFLLDAKSLSCGGGVDNSVAQLQPLPIQRWYGDIFRGGSEVLQYGQFRDEVVDVRWVDADVDRHFAVYEARYVVEPLAVLHVEERA